MLPYGDQLLYLVRNKFTNLNIHNCVIEINAIKVTTVSCIYLITGHAGVVVYEKYQPAYHQPAYNDGGVNFPGTLKYENLDLILTFIILYIVFADKFLCLSFSLRFHMLSKR